MTTPSDDTSPPSAHAAQADAGSAGSAPADDASAEAHCTAPDRWQWLESLDGPDGERALSWAVDWSARTERYADPEQEAELLALLDNDDRIPYPRRRGNYLYNVWQDADHRRGLWRRCTAESYLAGSPEWEVLLDVNALAAAEGESWVWKGATVCSPGYRRALLALSRGGADAVVYREFDLDSRTFVSDLASPEQAFDLPEAKTDISWLTEDTVLVGTDLGEGSVTTSGYPAEVRLWQRGTALADAPVLFRGEPTDVAVSARVATDRSLVTIDQATDFFHSVTRTVRLDTSAEARPLPEQLLAAEWTTLDLPLDASVTAFRGILSVHLREPWQPSTEGPTAPGGALLLLPLDKVIEGTLEAKDVYQAFAPDEHTALEGVTWTAHHLVLTTLKDVTTELVVLTPPDDALATPSGEWSRRVLKGLPEATTANVLSASPYAEGALGDEVWITTSGFITPETLWHCQLPEAPRAVRSLPELFDATALVTRQLWAISDDGTCIPYFAVGTPAALDAASGPQPTLLGGYGGFGISRVPVYARVLGAAWLARGGVYLLANIRGGGEYGPAWHEAARRERRPRSYEDFAAVARDAADRGITDAAHLACRGGSNGGLLTGVMLTRYPELFGAIVCQVPLLDMRRYHLLLAGASWMAEYGDPESEDWTYLREFSPYEQAVAPEQRHYPPVLLTSSTRDDRVHPGHARKMAALLNELGQPVDYHENTEGGHGGAADQAQIAHIEALIYRWLWAHLGSTTEGL